MQIRIGPAGIGGYNIEAVKQLKRLGLSAAEIPFTYGVRMTNETAKMIGTQAKKSGIALSVHAPYYINLASIEREKIVESRKRIAESCERAHYLGARYVVFHPGFYQGRDKKIVYEEILDSIEKLQEMRVENEWNVELAPETTGKKTQFGDIDELLRLKKETGCHICIDFAHLLARDGRRDYDKIFNKLKNLHIHSHFTGIEYNESGERRHLLTPENELRELLESVKRHNADITIINESPDPVADSVKTKELIKRIFKSKVKLSVL